MHALRMYIDLYERDVLFFIFARTRVYGEKEWERIPIRHFMHGVRAADGRYVCSPVAMSKTKLLEALRHLKGKGIIETRMTEDGTSNYRVRDESEIDVNHIRTYMSRHQQREFKSIFGRLHTIRGWSIFGPPPSPNLDQPPSPNLDQHNNRDINKPILKVAPEPARKVRTLNIRTRP